MRLLPVLILLLWAAPAPAAPVQEYEVVRTFPHDPRAYTQGLFFHRGRLYESTGQYGESNLRAVRLEDGKVLRTAPVPPTEFGEGSTSWGDEILSLTWKNGIGYRWDADTLKLKSSFRYPGEGWGLTQDGKNLILSDGSPRVRFLDPVTFEQRRIVEVTADGRPVSYLNELEWVEGEILANVWQTSRIARIDPATGEVKAWIDLAPLSAEIGADHIDNVLNGIAWEPKQRRLFVTGKRWPRMFEIRLKPVRSPR